MSRESELKSLKEQEKLLTELVNLQKNHVGSLEKTQKIEENINSIYEKRTRLEALGVKTTNQWYDNEDKLKKVKQDIIELDGKTIEAEEKIASTKKERIKYEEESSAEIEKQLKALEKQLNKELDILEGRETTKYIEEEIKDIKLDILAASSGLTDEEKKVNIAKNEKLNKLQKELELQIKIKKEQEEIEEKRKEYEENQKRIKKKRENAVKETTDKIQVPGLGMSISELRDAGERGFGANLFKAGVDTFNKAVEMFSSAVKEGITKQSNSYESNFTNIAVRTGMTSETYLKNQRELGGFGKNTLHEMGLMNNISTSEVQDMWNTLADRGMSQEQILASALDTVITNKLVPYLDTTTAELQQFNSIVGDNGLLKQVRGISKTSQAMFGSATTVEKYLQDALEYMSPMAESASIDLIKNTVGGVEMLQYLQSKEGGELSLSAISKLYNRGRNLQNDLVGSLESNDLTTRLAAVGIMQNNVNQYEDLAGVNNQSFIAQNTIRNLTPNNPILTALFSNATGTDGTLNWEILKKNPDLLGAYNKGMTAANNLDDSGKQATEDLANDKVQTLDELSKILVENSTNEIAVLKEQLGPIYDILKTLAKGIGIAVAGNLVTSIIGKGIGALSGLGGESLSGGLGALLGGKGALAGALGAAGPIALAVGAVGATAAAIYAFDKSQSAQNTKGNVELPERIKQLKAQAEANQKEQGQEVDSIKATVEALNTAQSRGNIGVWNSGSEVSVQPTKREKMANGQWVDVSTSMDDDNIVSYLSGNNIYDAFTDQSKEFRESYGLTPKALQSGSEEARIALDKFSKEGNSKAYNKIKAYALTNVVNNNKDNLDITKVAASILTAAYIGGKINDESISGPITEQLGIPWYTSKEDINKFMESAGIVNASDLKSTMRFLGSKEVDFYPRSSGGNYYAYPTEEQLKSEFNLHRTGLNRVPYDGYPALLHQDETVLSASTATELRQLIEDYRDTKSNDFEVTNVLNEFNSDELLQEYEALCEETARTTQAVQEQTSMLITKLDAIYTKIPSSSESAVQEIMPGRLEQNTRNLTTTYKAFA